MGTHYKCRGASDEYQQMFFLRNKKNIDIFWLKKNTLLRAMLSGSTLFALVSVLISRAERVKKKLKLKLVAIK